MKHLRAVQPGVRWMFFSCAMTAVMAGAIDWANLLETGISPWSVSLVRVLMNCLFLLIPFGGVGIFSARTPRTSRELWLWGLFGAVTVASYFSAVQLIGPGRATLIQSTQGIFVIALSPWLLRTRSTPLEWLAVLGSIGGLALMQAGNASAEAAENTGTLLALASGAGAALAYLMIARAGGRFSPAVVMLHWSVMNLILHGIVLVSISSVQIHWPERWETWTLLALGGAAASLAQLGAARSYQMGPPAMVTAAGYLAPLGAIAIDVAVTGLPLTLSLATGASLILFFGVLVPLSK